jgi:hypothetical protein
MHFSGKNAFFRKKYYFSQYIDFFKRKITFFPPKHGQNMSKHRVFSLKKGYQTTLPGRDFSMFVSMKLLAGEPQVMQNKCINLFQGINLKSGKAQVIDSLRVGLHVFFQNRFQKNNPLVIHWLWVGPILVQSI